MTTIREKNLRLLHSMGFKVAPSLPVQRSEGPVTLRPPVEIASRLLAIGSLFLWVADWGDDLTTPQLENYIASHQLRGFLAEDELLILALDREAVHDEAYSYNIGWRLENRWPLAWILGFEPAPSLQGMIGHDTITELLEFLAIPNESPEALLQRSLLRSVSDVDELEDLFYCTHNAVRSAQLGGKTVPSGFHPILDGGCVHERRHALTWALSPDIAWDDTDLST